MDKNIEKIIECPFGRKINYLEKEIHLCFNNEEVYCNLLLKKKGNIEFCEYKNQKLIDLEQSVKKPSNYLFTTD